MGLTMVQLAVEGIINRTKTLENAVYHPQRSFHLEERFATQTTRSVYPIIRVTFAAAGRQRFFSKWREDKVDAVLKCARIWTAFGVCIAPALDLGAGVADHEYTRICTSSIVNHVICNCGTHRRPAPSRHSLHCILFAIV